MDEKTELVSLSREKVAPKAKPADEWVETFFLSEIPDEPEIRIKIRPGDIERLKRHLDAAWRKDREAILKRAIEALKALPE